MNCEKVVQLPSLMGVEFGVHGHERAGRVCEVWTSRFFECMGIFRIHDCNDCTGCVIDHCDCDVKKFTRMLNTGLERRGSCVDTNWLGRWIFFQLLDLLTFSTTASNTHEQILGSLQAETGALRKENAGLKQRMATMEARTDGRPSGFDAVINTPSA